MENFQKKRLHHVDVALLPLEQREFVIDSINEWLAIYNINKLFKEDMTPVRSCGETEAMRSSAK